MKLLFDQNLSYRLVSELQNLYPDSLHVGQLGMSNATWTYAKNNQFTIVSKDSDFYYRSLVFGHPPKVVAIQLGNCSTKEIIELIKRRQPELIAFDQDAASSFLALK